MARSTPIDTTAATNANRVRQGRLGRPIFWVLLISTLLALAALLATWAWNAERLAATEPGAAREAAAAQTFEAPAP